MTATAPTRYPGSPLIALGAAARRRSHRAGRAADRRSAGAGASDVAARRGVSVVCGDGYAALKTYLPPRENRGLVLIDPPYEADNEFAHVERALRLGLSRWPNGVFALWYPIKVGREAQRLHAALQDSGLRKLLLLELSVRPADSPLGLNGSGLIDRQSAVAVRWRDRAGARGAACGAGAADGGGSASVRLAGRRSERVSCRLYAALLCPAPCIPCSESSSSGDRSPCRSPACARR